MFGSFPRQDWFCQRIHTGLGGFCFPSNVNGINHGDFQVAPAADVRWDESAELRQSVQGTCWLTMERLESRVDGGITTMFGLGSRSLVFLMGFACCMRDVCRGCCWSSWWKSAGHIQPTGFYHCSYIESFPLSSGRLDYMFYDRFEDLLFFFFFFLLLPLLEYISLHNNSIPDSVVCACSRRFAFITYFVFVFFIWLEGECRTVPEGLRELRAQVAGPVSSQRSVRAQEPLHGKINLKEEKKWMPLYLKSFPHRRF